MARPGTASRSSKGKRPGHPRTTPRPHLAAASTDPAGAPATYSLSTPEPSTHDLEPSTNALETPTHAPPSSSSSESDSDESLAIPPTSARMSPSDPNNADPDDISEEPLHDSSHPNQHDEWVHRACRDRDFAALEGLLLSLQRESDTEEEPARGTSDRIRYFARRPLEWCVNRAQAPETWLMTILFDLHTDERLTQMNDEIRRLKADIKALKSTIARSPSSSASVPALPSYASAVQVHPSPSPPKRFQSSNGIQPHKKNAASSTAATAVASFSTPAAATATATFRTYINTSGLDLAICSSCA